MRKMISALFVAAVSAFMWSSIAVHAADQNAPADQSATQKQNSDGAVEVGKARKQGRSSKQLKQKGEDVKVAKPRKRGRSSKPVKPTQEKVEQSTPSGEGRQ